MQIKTTDLVLKPIKGLRGKRPHNLPKGEIRAYVSINAYSNGGPAYQHPTVDLRVHNEKGTYGPSDTELCEIRFQRNWMNYDDTGISTWKNDVPARGFMIGCDNAPGKWNTCYAAKVSGDFTHSDGRYLQAGIDLMQRAYEAVSYSTNPKLAKALGKAHCDLLKLIAGFQRIGVVVVIRDGKTATTVLKARWAEKRRKHEVTVSPEAFAHLQDSLNSNVNPL